MVTNNLCVTNNPTVPAEHIDRELPEQIILLVEEFLATYGSRSRTIETYRGALNQFFSWLNQSGRLQRRLVAQDIVDFQTYLVASPVCHGNRAGHNRKINTINLYLSAIKRFYSWLESFKDIKNIAGSIKRKHKDRFFKGHLSLEQSNALLAYFRELQPETKYTYKKFNEYKARNYAMVNLMLRTGLRAKEVANIQIRDIDDELYDRRILRVLGKGKEEKDDQHFVILSDKCWEPIRAYLSYRTCVQATDPLFLAEGCGCSGRPVAIRTIQKVIKDGYRAIGLSERFTPHCLRHTTGVQILTHGGTIFDVKSVLRHADPATSEIYTKSVEREERLKNAPDLIVDNLFV